MNDNHTNREIISNMLRKQDYSSIVFFLMKLNKMSPHESDHSILDLFVESGVLALLSVEYIDQVGQSEKYFRNICKLILRVSGSTSFYIDYLISIEIPHIMLSILESGNSKYTLKLRQLSLAVLGNLVSDSVRIRNFIIDLGLPKVLDFIIINSNSNQGHTSNWDDRSSILFLILVNNIIRLRPLPNEDDIQVLLKTYSTFILKLVSEPKSGHHMDLFYHISWGLCYLSESPNTIQYLTQQRGIVFNIFYLFVQYMISNQIFSVNESSISTSLLRALGNLLIEENYRKLGGFNLDDIIYQLSQYLRMNYNGIKREICWIYSNISCYQPMKQSLLEIILEIWKDPETISSIKFEIAWIFLNSLIIGMDFLEYKNIYQSLFIPFHLSNYLESLKLSSSLLLENDLVIEFNSNLTEFKKFYDFNLH